MHWDSVLMRFRTSVEERAYFRAIKGTKLLASADRNADGHANQDEGLRILDGIHHRVLFLGARHLWHSAFRGVRKRLPNSRPVWASASPCFNHVLVLWN